MKKGGWGWRGSNVTQTKLCVMSEDESAKRGLIAQGISLPYFFRHFHTVSVVEAIPRVLQ